MSVSASQHVARDGEPRFSIEYPCSEPTLDVVVGHLHQWAPHESGYSFPLSMDITERFPQFAFWLHIRLLLVDAYAEFVQQGCTLLLSALETLRDGVAETFGLDIDVEDRSVKLDPLACAGITFAQGFN